MGDIVRVIVDAFVGLIFVCLFVLNPLIHYIAGPIAPLLGGMVGSRVARVRQDQGTAMGGLLALLNALALVAFVWGLALLFPDIVHSVPVFVIVGGVVLVAAYGALLSMLGAVLGSRASTA